MNFEQQNPIECQKPNSPMTQRAGQQVDGAGEKKPLVRRRLWIALAGTGLLFILLEGVPVILSWGPGYDLTLRLSTPQTEYKLGDAIPIILTLKNNGRATFPKNPPWTERIPFFGRRSGWEEPTFQFGLRARRKDGRACMNVEDGGIGQTTYYGNEIRVEGGKSRNIRTALNGYVLIREPGIYLVRGQLGLFESKPIEVVISPRTKDETEAHASQLLKELKRAKSVGGTSLYSALVKLIYARDSRAVPDLLNYEYSGFSYLSHTAFMWYLPINEETKTMILEAATERGLTDTILLAMVRFGCSEEELRNVVGKWLESEDGRSLEVALAEACYYPDDSYTPALAKLARKGEEGIREEAIRALVWNRTEMGVEVLREALSDPDGEIWSAAKHEILLHYRCDGEFVQPLYPPRYVPILYGRALTPGDFYYSPESHVPREVMRSVIDLAHDPNETGWLQVVEELLREVSDGDLEMVKALGNGALTTTDVADANDCVKVIADLLNNRDADVRDITLTRIRLSRRPRQRRLLKPEDFPEIYKEAQETKRFE